MSDNLVPTVTFYLTMSWTTVTSEKKKKFFFYEHPVFFFFKPKFSPTWYQITSVKAAVVSESGTEDIC